MLFHVHNEYHKTKSPAQCIKVYCKQHTNDWDKNFRACPSDFDLKNIPHITLTASYVVYIVSIWEKTVL